MIGTPETIVAPSWPHCEFEDLVNVYANAGCRPLVFRGEIGGPSTRDNYYYETFHIFSNIQPIANTDGRIETGKQEFVSRNQFFPMILDGKFTAFATQARPSVRATGLTALDSVGKQRPEFGHAQDLH